MLNHPYLPFYKVSFRNIPEKIPSIFFPCSFSREGRYFAAIVNTNWLLGQILNKKQAHEDLVFQEENLEPLYYSMRKEKDRKKDPFCDLLWKMWFWKEPDEGKCRHSGKGRKWLGHGLSLFVSSSLLSVPSFLSVPPRQTGDLAEIWDNCIPHCKCNAEITKHLSLLRDLHWLPTSVAALVTAAL